MKRLARFLKRVFRSHLAHVLLAVSWTFILFTSMPPRDPQFVDCVPIGDEVYSHNVMVDVIHPIWTVAIGVSHLPAIGLTVGATKLLQRLFSLSCDPTAKVEVSLFFGFSAIQWFVVGYTIESIFRRMRSRS